MTWAKVDDHANEHRKQLAAGAEACWLWTCGLMYANRQAARDGFIPTQIVGMLYPLKSVAKLVERLIAVGLWDPVDGGYQIHEFTTWNQTKEQREAELASGRERAAKSYASRRRSESSSGEEQPQSPTEESPVLQGSSGSIPSPFHSNPKEKFVEREPDISQDSLNSFAPDPVKDRQKARREAEQSVFDCWRGVMGHSSAKFDANRRSKIAARMREGFTREQLCEAIRNAKNDPFLMGENDTGTKYDELISLLKNGAKVEKLIALKCRPAPRLQHRADPRNEAQDRNADHYMRERLEASAKVRGLLEMSDKMKAAGQ